MDKDTSKAALDVIRKISNLTTKFYCPKYGGVE